MRYQTLSLLRIKKIDLNKILISKHHEFKYFINNYSFKLDRGTVGSSFKTLKLFI